MVNEDNKFSALIIDIRDEFLESLIEKCDQIEAYVLELGHTPQLRTFNELFRLLHNAKGSGGSHGLFYLVSICHQFEDLLVNTRATYSFDEGFVNEGLFLVDLIRQIVECERKGEDYDSADYAGIEKKLADISKRQHPHTKKILISDSSRTMAKFYVDAFKSIDSISATLTDNGFDALKRLFTSEYDLLICACEQKGLDGPALLSALRDSNSKNNGIPIILICNGAREHSFDYERILIIDRDENLGNNFLAQVKSTLEHDQRHNRQ